MSPSETSKELPSQSKYMRMYVHTCVWCMLGLDRQMKACRVTCGRDTVLSPTSLSFHTTVTTWQCGSKSEGLAGQGWLIPFS